MLTDSIAVVRRVYEYGGGSWLSAAASSAPRCFKQPGLKETKCESLSSNLPRSPGIVVYGGAFPGPVSDQISTLRTTLINYIAREKTISIKLSSKGWHTIP